MDSKITIADLKIIISAFITEREWQQYHSPKNLAMAIACEASELMEHFLWCESNDSYEVFKLRKQEIEHEVSDITFALIEFCMQTNIDLPVVLQRKMILSKERYPSLDAAYNPLEISLNETLPLADIKRYVQKFMKARDWEQFNAPKNIAMAIGCEAAELMEHFQWCTSADSFEKLTKNRIDVEHEVADIFMGVLEFCNQTGIDLSAAIEDKMVLMNEKYPVEKSKGKSLKYNEF